MSLKLGRLGELAWLEVEVLGMGGMRVTSELRTSLNSWKSMPWFLFLSKKSKRISISSSLASRSYFLGNEEKASEPDENGELVDVEDGVLVLVDGLELLDEADAFVLELGPEPDEDLQGAFLVGHVVRHDCRAVDLLVVIVLEARLGAHPDVVLLEEVLELVELDLVVLVGVEAVEQELDLLLGQVGVDVLHHLLETTDQPVPPYFSKVM